MADTGGQGARDGAPVRITVQGQNPYDVVIGRDLGDLALRELPDSAARVAIIHPPTMVGLAESLRGSIAATSRSAIMIEIPDGERGKSASVAEYCWSVLGESGFTRTDVVIGFGGGAVTDLAGFVAATWLRGVPLVQIPTTLLAMVDASVGGKTGINTAHGKNLVGSFYPPTLVVADLSVLGSMPAADYVTGMAEVIKYGFIADPVILDLVESDPVAACDPAAELCGEFVRRSVQVKADVVAGDFRESVEGPAGGGIGREVLNYGHTFGHAIEREQDYTWRHGQAISVGMVFAAELASIAGLLAPGIVARHRQVLSCVGLPTSYPQGQWRALSDAMMLDKKTRANALRFVVLDDIAVPRILRDPKPEFLVAAFDRVCRGLAD
ncbi:MAG: 3-dehydroquinate synthase [Actinomycetes bacterium]